MIIQSSKKVYKFIQLWQNAVLQGEVEIEGVSKYSWKVTSFYYSE